MKRQNKYNFQNLLIQKNKKKNEIYKLKEGKL